MWHGSHSAGDKVHHQAHHQASAPFAVRHLLQAEDVILPANLQAKPVTDTPEFVNMPARPRRYRLSWPVAKQPTPPFVDLNASPAAPSGRFFVIGALCGDYDQLKQIIDKIIPRLRPEDHIVFTGNYFGYGGNGPQIFDELLQLRRWVLSAGPWQPRSKFILLRGQQEEMLQSLFRLPLPKNFQARLDFMEKAGMPPLLESFGLTWTVMRTAAYLGEGYYASWASAALDQLASFGGLDDFILDLRYCAYSHKAGLIISSCGWQKDLALDQQKSQFIWGSKAQTTGTAMAKPQSQDEFRLNIYGFSPHDTPKLAKSIHHVSLDGGAGRSIHSADGHSADGHSADGHSADGHSADGQIKGLGKAGFGKAGFGKTGAILISASGTPLQWL